MIFIKDEEFLRGESPMTKEEVRIISIAKMELKEDYRCLDIGAGTGSVSIQMAKFCLKGKVLAIEKEDKAIQTLYENINKFGCHNIEVIKGEASNILDSIEPGFDSIFVGGSGGNIENIIEKSSNLLKPQGRMILNFVTLDNVYRAIKTLEDLEFHVECSQIAVSKARGKSYMLFANNPIFILCAEKRKE